MFSRTNQSMVLIHKCVAEILTTEPFICRGHRHNAAIEQFIQTGLTAAIRLHAEVQMVDPDDEARSFPSSPQCDVPLQPLLAYVNQPAALVIGKGLQSGWQKTGYELWYKGKRNTQRERGRGRSKGLLFCDLSRSNPMQQHFTCNLTVSQWIKKLPLYRIPKVYRSSRIFLKPVESSPIYYIAFINNNNNEMSCRTTSRTVRNHSNLTSSTLTTYQIFTNRQDSSDVSSQLCAPFFLPT
jgi:hypothetical protein